MFPQATNFQKWILKRYYAYYIPTQLPPHLFLFTWDALWVADAFSCDRRVDKKKSSRYLSMLHYSIRPFSIFPPPGSAFDVFAVVFHGYTTRTRYALCLFPQNVTPTNVERLLFFILFFFFDRRRRCCRLVRSGAKRIESRPTVTSDIFSLV